MRAVAAALLVAAATAGAQEGPWKADAFRAAPAFRGTDALPQPGVRAILFDGAPYHGAPTQVYAYWSLPPGAPPPGGWPGVVLLHGGGGTAFAEWVRRWNAAGFAAIAPDLEGRLPDASVPTAKRPRTPAPGPDQMGNPADTNPADQFFYHAVADALLAHSLLAAAPGVDPAKVGLCGISWGGVWTGVAAGLDARTAFAIPLYGCGFLDESEGLVRTPARLAWDPSRYLPRAACPMLFVVGTNDRNFPPPPWEKSADACGSGAARLLLPVLVHDHPNAWSLPEPYAFARAAVAGGREALPGPGPIAAEGGGFSAAWAGEGMAELWYTADAGPFADRRWQSLAALRQGGRLAASPPAATAAFFLVETPLGRRSSPVWFAP